MSKSVTFLIGNGFDIKVGLKTRYTDFYPIYIKDYNSEEIKDRTIIEKFKKQILATQAENWKDWKDFEIGMGQQSKCFDGENPADDFIKCFSNFAVCFNNYLNKECKKIDWDAVDQTLCNKFILSITHFYEYTKSVLSNTISDLFHHSGSEPAEINFIQFNYTNAFDELVKKSNLSQQLSAELGRLNSLNTLGLNLHVHGKMNDYPTIGVNDESQIENETIRNDPRVRQEFVKPNYLDLLESDNVNKNIARTDAISVINESNLICSFGVSIGASDKYWWEKIGKWLTNTSGVFVIFDICDDGEDDGINPDDVFVHRRRLSERKKEITDRFMSLANINSEWLNKNPNKIIVELNSDLFSFKLPKKEERKPEQTIVA